VPRTRGSLMLLRGDSGAGKTTFLNNLYLFRDGVVTRRVPSGIDVAGALAAVEPTEQPRVLVLEGREALGQISKNTLEEAMHAINAFLRSEAGSDTLVVWPTNTDALTALLIELGGALGAEALFGVGDPATTLRDPCLARAKSDPDCQSRDDVLRHRELPRRRRPVTDCPG
jgi:hypothetical protein